MKINLDSNEDIAKKIKPLKKLLSPQTIEININSLTTEVKRSQKNDKK